MFSPTMVSLQLRGSPGSLQNGKLHICLIPLGPEWGQPFRSWERKQFTGGSGTSELKFHLQAVVVGMHCALVGTRFLSAAPVSTRTKETQRQALGQSWKEASLPSSIALNTSQSLLTAASSENRGCHVSSCDIIARRGLYAHCPRSPTGNFLNEPLLSWEKSCSVCLYFPLHPSTGSLGWQHQHVLWLLLQIRLKKRSTPERSIIANITLVLGYWVLFRTQYPYLVHSLFLTPIHSHEK